MKICKVVNGKNWLKFRNFCLFSMDVLAEMPFLPDWSINSGVINSVLYPGDKNSTESDFLVISKIFTSVFSM